MTTKKPDCEASWAAFIADYDRLLKPGVLGVHDWVEATEIVGFPPARAAPVNVFSIFVSQERDDGAAQSLQAINGDKRIRVPSLNDWSFGIFRYGLSIADFRNHLVLLGQGQAWGPGGKRLETGSLCPVPAQFVPADTYRAVPWNHVLKNNFHAGSYVLELAAQKPALKPLLNNPQRIQALSEAICRIIPLRIASLSDRLGSICVQIPVTAIAWGIRRASSDKLIGEVAWHSHVDPRQLLVSCAFEFDGTVRGFTTREVTTGEVDLPVRNDRGMHRVSVWDQANGLLLSAIGEAAFINTISMDIRPTDSEPRVFETLDAAGQTVAQRVSVSALSMPAILGSGQSDDTAGATRRRMYQDEAHRLREEGRFVQFKPGGVTSVMDALETIRDLIRRHGRAGCWLWDPYLDANDVLRTLFFCPYGNSDLRALSAARTHDANSANVQTFITREHATLEHSKGNGRGLRLEFRARHGAAGWPFHDRFLIFPRSGEPALAWSLGTSINSFGQDHHILQQVGDGQLIADAFEELWNALAAPTHVIWKSFT